MSGVGVGGGCFITVFPECGNDTAWLHVLVDFLGRGLAVRPDLARVALYSVYLCWVRYIVRLDVRLDFLQTAHCIHTGRRTESTGSLRRSATNTQAERHTAHSYRPNGKRLESLRDCDLREKRPVHRASARRHEGDGSRLCLRFAYAALEC